MEWGGLLAGGELLPSPGGKVKQLPGKNCFLYLREGEQLLGENCFLHQEEGEQLPEEN